MTQAMVPVPALPAGSRVLVTGASGFTGAVLTRKLCGMPGVSVRAIARPTSDLSALQDLDVEWVRGQVFDPAVAASAMRGVTHVFHVAAAYRDAGITDEVYRDVHVTSTRHLAAEAAKTEGFLRFVHVSTVGVHGHIDDPPADETYRFKPGDIYQVTKAEAERWLHAFAAEHTLPYTVIRPAAIYGPGDRRLLKVFKMACKPVFILLGRGQCLYHLIHVDDLANAMLTAAMADTALGEAFICGNPEAVTLEQMGRVIANALGRRLRVLRLPAWPFFLAADICEAVCRPLRLSPPIYRRRVAFFTKDRSFNTSKLRNVLGYTPRIANEEGLAATAAWYREQGWL
jgi:nucleoside-diphosphate-sugar epimerase